MKKLTALFLDVLGEQTGQESRAAALAKENMQADLSKKTGELMTGGTLFFSREGHGVLEETNRLWEFTENMTTAGQAAEISDSLSRLFVETERLHRETQKQIHKAGHINASHLHFFYPGEQSDALSILEKYIRIEMFRILTLLGGKTFLTLEPLDSYQHTLQDRMRYLNDQIQPITEQKMMKDLSTPHFWAVTYNNEMKVGPFGMLPGFEIAEPLKMDRRLLPGEHSEISDRRSKVLQGVGYLTNVTPDIVETVQRGRKLHINVTPKQLAGCGCDLKNPQETLHRIFDGQYYAIDPAVYFGAASYVTASSAIAERKKRGLCLLCGRETGENKNDFCEQCRRRIRII